MQALSALAILELQRGRTASAFAWLRAAQDETLPADADSELHPLHDAVRGRWSPPMAEVMVLGRRDGDSAGLLDVHALLEVTERAFAVSAVARPWMHWMQGIATPEVDAAAEHLRAALTGVRGEPLVEARIEMIWGVRLAEAGRTDEARTRLQTAADSFRVREASGWVALVEQELERLPSGPPGAGEWYENPAAEPAAIVERRPEMRGAPGQAGATAHPAWEICLLGSFSVRRYCKEVSLPLSLAAQGLKIVTLREKIPVEELVELLWADAEPGVGTRRLRNVLWRVRAACGDLLQRDGNFIRLAPRPTYRGSGGWPRGHWPTTGRRVRRLRWPARRWISTVANCCRETGTRIGRPRRANRWRGCTSSCSIFCWSRRCATSTGRRRWAYWTA
jgi:hypothetical protein